MRKGQTQPRLGTRRLTVNRRPASCVRKHLGSSRHGSNSHFSAAPHMYRGRPSSVDRCSRSASPARSKCSVTISRYARDVVDPSTILPTSTLRSTSTENPSEGTYTTNHSPIRDKTPNPNQHPHTQT